MDFGLTDEQRAVVATTKSFVERELYPHEEEVERTGVLRPELAEQITAKAIRSGLHAANMPEEVGGAGLDTVTGGALREGARQGELRPALLHRAALQHPAGRHRDPEGALPLPQHPRRATRLPRADGARRWLRPAGHAHPSGARRRRMADQGHQALHQPRPGVRLRDPLCRHGRAGRWEEGDVDVPRRPRHPRAHRARRLPQRVPPRVHQRDPRLRQLPRARRRTSRRGGPRVRPGGHVARQHPAAGGRDAVWGEPNGRWTWRSSMLPTGSSSDRRSGASRASPSSSPTWRWSCGQPSC